MIKKIKASDLKFPIDKMWQPKSSCFSRWIARHSAAKILNSDCRTYQFGGYTGALKIAYELVDADKEELAHWILRDSGYLCCIADLMKITGYDPEKKE